ncbi:S9 family peptidase [Gluconobacter wancherniae]|uniref:Peptidase n=2 Tax=Gluconobacter wancherniae TaxID=1307955 RepID=A0A511B2W8_9PROT|nr:DPP IV N-terminal domain-containing protein [Gluconobacter wancherniae]MBF0854924.1 S9 family peptidase [Gluconobacter wancherniae]GBD57909.1 peptidase S9 [Gluconobacter wancherniae NBRC 103581]GEK94800.1 peptidase [Gluconobacter wancherniae NBRC 103581]
MLSRRLRRAALLCACATPLAVTAISNALAADPAACMIDLAKTRNGTLGLPIRAQMTPDGRSALFVRSGPSDTRLHLYRYDLADHSTHELAAPASGPETLSVAEKARRERARQSMSGIAEYQLSDDGQTVLASEGGHLERVDLQTGKVSPVSGDWIAPRLSPNGKMLAVVKDNDLYSVDLATNHETRLTTGGTETLTHGLAEFAAAEELERADGAWWSPDNQQLLFEEADTSGVEKHYITNPQSPQSAPVEFRYPRAGTENAKTRFGLVSASGGPVRWISWDHDAFPYLGRVVWRKNGGLFVVLLNRAQTQEQLLSVDAATGAAKPILSQSDAAWIELDPRAASGGHDLPVALADGSGFLWAADRGKNWQLELHAPDGRLKTVLTPPNLPYVALNDYDAASGTLTVTVRQNRIDNEVVHISLKDGSISPIVTEHGIHNVHFTPGAHAMMVDNFLSANGTRQALLRDRDGHILGTLPSVAETPKIKMHVQFTTAGARDLDAAIIRPEGFVAGRHYPVALSVYAGPGVKLVHDTPSSFIDDQCLANQGYIVVTLDGRGTPGRNHDFERAIKGNLIDAPLQDQVDGLQALGKRFPELDLSRTGVYGWSFGGYFTAMATIRRPDVFKVGVAGAPPVDFADYDTAYTERYLGVPKTDAEGYRKSNVLTYASNLQRPLLLMHGITDDNVYFENTMKLTQELLHDGKPYDLLLLPGTHMLPDPVIRARVTERRVQFLGNVLKPGK